MRNILDIYNEYKIMQNLQMHQFRVAGVAMQICESLMNEGIEVDKQLVITACLTHDMGNIIKFQLPAFPEFLEPEGLEYWEAVQSEYIEKYGKDEHEATIKILPALGVSQKVIAIVDLIGYPYLEQVLNHQDFNNKIATYADFRVCPYGVASIRERAEDGKKRYAHRLSDATEEERDKKWQCLFDLEKQIFSELTITPEEINDTSVAPYIKKLQEFEL